jgi:hypothetical protein
MSAPLRKDKPEEQLSTADLAQGVSPDRDRRGASEASAV